MKKLQNIYEEISARNIPTLEESTEKPIFWSKF